MIINDFNIDDFWAEFLKVTNRNADIKCSGKFNFGTDEFTSMRMLAMVWDGKRKSRLNSIENYNEECKGLKAPGEFYVITNFRGDPYMVVEMKDIVSTTLNELPHKLAEIEGDGVVVENREKNYINQFVEDEKNKNRNLKDDSIIVIEVFELVYRRYFPVV